MKKSLIVLFSIALIAFFSTQLIAGKGGKRNDCATIQHGEIYSSDGNLITPGYDEWGYNYQARMFNGYYCDVYRDAEWCHAYRDVELIMKWNSAWLSNKDCDGDGLLDRHYGLESYIGSGAWVTNHQSGRVDVNGKLRKWTHFIKIVAAPEDAFLEDATWFTADGIEIGPEIWGAFAIIQEVLNDPSSGAHGILYKSPVAPGLGLY